MKRFFSVFTLLIKQKMTVTILVFGRETSVELDFTQVEKI